MRQSIQGVFQMAGDRQGRSFSLSNGQPGEGCGKEGLAQTAVRENTGMISGLQCLEARARSC